jgi:hypothetical protein
MRIPDNSLMKSPFLPTRFYLQAAASLTVAGVVFLSEARANLVVNGGFEAGATTVNPINGTAVGGGNTSQVNGSLAGWDVGGGGPNNVLATNESLYYATITNGDPAGGGPRTGDLAAVFPNFPVYDGYISQAVIGVVAGQAYRISFWLSNQIGDSTLNSINVNWGGTFTNSSSPITGGVSLSGFPAAIPVAVGWTPYSFDVVAPTNDARLSFIGGADAAAILLDDVIVVVPEVSSFGFAMGLGLLALGSTIRLRRRALATA